MVKLEFSKLLSRVRFPYSAHMNNANYVSVGPGVLFHRHYLHQDGGLYYVIGIGKSSVDVSTHVIYEHMFPFEQTTWLRPLAEWTPARFKLLTEDEAVDFMDNLPDRAEYQEKVTKAKAVRRAIEVLKNA